MDKILGESRSEDYEPIYDKLDEIGRRILTSTYLVEYQDTAVALLRHLLEGLPTGLKDRIKRFWFPSFQPIRLITPVGSVYELVEVLVDLI
jgi:hypothetical protein